MTWLDRLQTLMRGESWKGKEEGEVTVNESLLQQLVSQGFPAEAARVALRKTKNDDFAALLILTCPSEDADASRDSTGSGLGDDQDESDQAKTQRLLDFFRDLGEQYWGWQMESAKRGRGFKGALKENFLPLLPHLRQLAAKPHLSPFGTSMAVQYQALCFMNRGLDECPPASEDRDRDRYRMSMDTAPYVVCLVKSIGVLQLQDYKDSLVCELVKETLKLLGNLAGSAVSSRLDDTDRLDCTTMLVKLVGSFHTLIAVSEHNAGLPGASGKISAVELKPAVRALAMFVTFHDSSNAQAVQETALHLEQMSALLSRNDPKLVEGVLSVWTSFLQSFALLPSADCDRVLGHMMRPQGPVTPLLLRLLASATGKVHNLVVSFVCSLCLLSGRVLEELLDSAPDAQRAAAAALGDGDETMKCAADLQAGVEAERTGLLECLERALEHESMQVRCAGLLRVIDTVLCCIVDGRKAAAKDKSSGGRGGFGTHSSETDYHRQISDIIFEEDVEEIELREMLESEEMHEDEGLRTRAVLGASDRRRAELEIRMQRLRRAKIARLQEARSRRHFCSEGPGRAGAEGSGGGGGRASSTFPRDLTTGTRVKRGPDWKWHGQDGGPGNEGLVVSGTDKNSDGWVRVQWDKGGVNGYRWGAENSYDVEPVHVSGISTAVRNKDLTALREAISQEESSGDSLQGAFNPLLEAINCADEAHEENDVRMVVALVEELGANPNMLSSGRLPLHAAIERGRADIVCALLEHKADPAAKDGDGMSAIEFLSRCIMSLSAEGSRSQYANYGRILRILEDRAAQPSPIVRRFKFEKDGDQRLFGRGHSGFRYPMPLQLSGNVSFSVSLRIKHLDPTGIRRGRACLLHLGSTLEGDTSKTSSARGFSAFLHTRGHMHLGPGLCEKSHTSVNIACCRGKWATITFVYESADAMLKVYVDGSLKASEQVRDKVDLDASGNMLIGIAPEWAAKDDRSRFHGVLADIQVYDKALHEDEAAKLHDAVCPQSKDAHPGLQTPFCDSVSRMLLNILSRPMVYGQNMAHCKRHMLAMLSRILPLCSSALLSGTLQVPLVRSLETLISNAPCQRKGKRDHRAAENFPCQIVSLLICIDAVMRTTAHASFEQAFRRSGIVAAILHLSQVPSWESSSTTLADAHSQVPYQLVHFPHDLALYLIETHFGGCQGATHIPDVGHRVSAALSEVCVHLTCKGKVQGSAGLHSENQVRQALEQVAALFQKPEGVYSEELLASGLPQALVEFLRSGNDDPGRMHKSCSLLERVLGGSDRVSFDHSPLLQLVTCLRVAVDKLSHGALPLILHDDGASSDLKALKQWVAIRFEKCKSDTSDLRELPSGFEARAEPLGLVKNLRSTLEGMLQSLVPSVGKSREERQGELRSMLQAFGEDPEGAPPLLLEHMRHFVDAEPRSHDVVLPIQRKFEALPSIHTWDREVTVTGAAKRSLPVALAVKSQSASTVGLGTSSNAASSRSSSINVPADTGDDKDVSDDDPEVVVPGRFEMFRRSSARIEMSGQRAGNQSSGSKRSIALDLYLCLGKRAQGSARTHDFSVMRECDEMLDDQDAASVGGRWVMCGSGGASSYANLPPLPRLSAGSSHRPSAAADHSNNASLADEASEKRVLLEDGETLFEAMSRLYALLSRHESTMHPPQMFVHPGKFWEETFTIKYRSRVPAENDSKKEQDVCVEIPKTVMRHVLGRGSSGIRKIERETGARIFQTSVGGNEARVLRVSGRQDQIDEAVKLLFASAREAPTWRESRDAAILEQYYTGARRSQGATSAADAKMDPCDSGQGSSAAASTQAQSSSPSCGSSAVNNDGKDSDKLAFLSLSPLQSCLQLLNKLARRMEGEPLRYRSLAICETLELYVSKQLDDSLVVGSGLVQKLPWIFEVCKLHANLSLSVRERYFLAGAFGPSRALSTLKNMSGPSTADDGEDGMLQARTIQAHTIFASDRPRMYFCPRRSESICRVPELFHETVEIDHQRDGHDDKPNLMTWAEQILEAHSKRETVLDVTWTGEAGHGSGPTRKFFEKVAALLGSKEENAACQVWRDVEDGNKCGLFPAPLPDENVARSAVLKRLRFIGLFMGKALQQRQMPGLCLAKPLYKMLIGETVDFKDVKDIDSELSAGVESILERRQIRDQILTDQSLDDAQRQDRLSAFDHDLCMFENAAEEQVTHKNLDGYAHELVEECVAKMHIDEQIEALRDGISAVFPWKMLCVFSPTELQQKLWSDLEWDEAKLEKIVRPGPMWPQDKEQIGWLRRELMNMDTRQRRAFVKFVTASVCMPVETNPIIVHPQVATRRDAENGDDNLPTTRTCANILYLPAYSSPTVLQRRLEQAIWEEHIEFD